MIMNANYKERSSWRVLVSVLFLLSVMVVGAKECREAYPTLETYRIHFAYGVMEDGSRTQVGMSPNQENTVQFKENKYVHIDIALDGTACPFPYYYRQDGYKIFRWKEDESDEELVFDFMMSVGDEFVCPNGIHLRVVEACDTTINYYYPNSRMLKLEGVDDPSVKDTWIEGCGSVHTGLLVSEDIPGIQHMNILYLWDDLDLSFWWNTDEEYLKTQHIYIQELYPVGEKSSHLHYSFEGDSLHVTGELVVSPPNLFFSLEIYQNTLVLTWTALPPSYALQTYMPVDLKFGKFSAGTYEINGMGMEPVTLICEVPTDIKKVDRHLYERACFDLQGRRLLHEPEKGMYIKNGRKFWIK